MTLTDVPNYSFESGHPVRLFFQVAARESGGYRADCECGIESWCGMGNTADDAIHFLRWTVAQHFAPRVVILRQLKPIIL